MYWFSFFFLNDGHNSFLILEHNIAPYIAVATVKNTNKNKNLKVIHLIRSWPGARKRGSHFFCSFTDLPKNIVSCSAGPQLRKYAFPLWPCRKQTPVQLPNVYSLFNQNRADTAWSKLELETSNSRHPRLLYWNSQDSNMAQDKTPSAAALAQKYELLQKHIEQVQKLNMKTQEKSAIQKLL